jgi:hypothetical protein
VPFFGAFMSILGSFLTITVSVLFPCMAHLKLNWSELNGRQKAVDYGILGIGGFAAAAGTWTAVASLPGGGNAAGQLDLITANAPAAGTQIFKTLVCHSLCFTQ